MESAQDSEFKKTDKKTWVESYFCIYQLNNLEHQGLQEGSKDLYL